MAWVYRIRDALDADRFCLFAQEIVPLRNEVDEARLRGDLDLDQRVPGKQLRKPRPEHRLGSILGGRDADGARRLVAQFSDGHQFRLDLLETGSDVLHQSLPGFRRRNTAGRARQQPDSHPDLEGTDQMTQGRLGHAELRRGAREALLSCDRDERQQVVVAALHHI